MSEHGVLYLFWAGNTAIGRTFILLLLALGTAAAVIAWAHTRRYRGREMDALNAVRGQLRRAQDADAAPPADAAPSADAEREGEEPAPAAPRPPAVVELYPLLEQTPRDTLIGDRLAALARMKQVRVKVHVDALQQMTVMRENARMGLAFPGYAVDLCTMGGMLGTFIGLCLMLLQMQGVMPGGGNAGAGGFADAAASLGAIIASKKTAFVTTLVGLSCAIVVSFLNFLLVRAQSAFYDALERFTVAELLPATVPAVEDETMLEKLSLQMSEAFATLGEVAQGQQNQAELQKAMQEAFSATVESIRTLALHAAARGPEAESGASVAALVQQMGAASAALVKTAESVSMSVRRADAAYRPAAQPAAGWRGLGRQLLGLVTDTVAQLRENPLLAVGGVCAVIAFLLLR